MADPRLAGVNVTRVEISGDLRYAKIFVAPQSAGDPATREMMEGLKHATGYFRRQIAASLDLRFAPEIRFLVDRAIEKGEHFLQALDQIHAEERRAAEDEKERTSTKGRRPKPSG